MNNRFQSTTAAFPFLMCSFSDIYMKERPRQQADRHTRGPSCFKNITPHSTLHSHRFYALICTPILFSFSLLDPHVYALYYLGHFFIKLSHHIHYTWEFFANKRAIYYMYTYSTHCYQNVIYSLFSSSLLYLLHKNFGKNNYTNWKQKIQSHSNYKCTH